MHQRRLVWTQVCNTFILTGCIGICRYTYRYIIWHKNFDFHCFEEFGSISYILWPMQLKSYKCAHAKAAFFFLHDYIHEYNFVPRNFCAIRIFTRRTLTHETCAMYIVVILACIEHACYMHVRLTCLHVCQASLHVAWLLHACYMNMHVTHVTCLTN